VSAPETISSVTTADSTNTVEGSGGVHALEVARQAGVRAMFTLSGGHVFPLYDAAVKAEPPVPLIDVRHEASAVFAAEASAKLGRVPGLAVLTAGPGVTNGVSAITTAHFNGSPVLVLGGRAPALRWGSGSLQEFDHPPLLSTITKYAATAGTLADVPTVVSAALEAATTPHRGPAFVDIPLDVAFSVATLPAPPPVASRRPDPEPEDLQTVARAVAAASRPVLVLGSDVWADGASDVARHFAEELGIPVVMNGMGRGTLRASAELNATRVRGAAFGGADLVVVAGTPLDFRLGFGSFGGKDGAPPADVVHLADSPAGVAGHVPLVGSAAGDLGAVFAGILDRLPRRPDTTAWLARLRDLDAAARERLDAEVASEGADGIHPARVYGELRSVLDPDAVVVGDGGDFVSYAGRLVEQDRPGCWLDPGPFGCLGTGLGYTIGARVTRPDAQVVLLLGDGAAGFSLMDVDTLVRHRMPAVLLVGNNGIWGLEKHPMRAVYGYDVAAELQSGCRYDQVVTALGGGGELVTDAAELGPALRRALAESRASSLPYCVNVLLDPSVAYPRSANLA
jgi:acetolactate synthase-1/2/3 large subunit